MEADCTENRLLKTELLVFAGSNPAPAATIIDSPNNTWNILLRSVLSLEASQAI